MNFGADVDASCAICGAPPYPECPHEGRSLEMALDQAELRWEGRKRIRDWVLDHARDHVILTFQQLKAARHQAHLAYLQTLPCFTLYQRYHGNPPLQPAQLHLLHNQINQAQAIFKTGVDEDWRRSCLKYPEVLDYFFNLVGLNFPEDRDSSVRDPRFGRGLRDARNGNAPKKKDRRRSRGRTPSAPMPPRHGR